MQGYSLLSHSEVEEVAERAWQNVSAGSGLYPPLDVLASLLDLESLPEDQLRYRAQVQYVLSDEVRDLLNAIPSLLSRLAQTSKSSRDETRVVGGNINWPATLMLQRKLGGGWYVKHRTDTVHDVMENRLLRFVLGELRSISDDLLNSRQAAGWLEGVMPIRTTAVEALRHPLLSNVPSQWSRAGLLAARASRIPGYRAVAKAYVLYEFLFRLQASSVLLDLLRRSILLPQKEDRVFELLVLFRLITHLEVKGAVRVGLRLIGRGSGPTFSFTRGSQRIDVHYQNLPAELYSLSLYRKYLLGASLAPGTRRPDIVVRIHYGTTQRYIFFEVKCSDRLPTIRDGAFQLLGYHSDFRLTADNSILCLVGYGPLPRPPTWPAPAMDSPFEGRVTDLPGFEETLMQLGLP